jgi:hypothetical protein
MLDVIANIARCPAKPFLILLNNRVFQESRGHHALFWLEEEKLPGVG